MAAQRITEDFVKHFQLLSDRTGNSPHNLHRALDRDENLAASIRELDRIWRMLEEHRRISKRRFIVQVDPKFWKALKEYSMKWTSSLHSLLDWEAKREGRETPTEFIERLLAELPDAPADNTGADSIDGDWDFEPDTHSAASHVKTVIEYLEGRIEDEPWFSRALGAFTWFTGTVGLDFEHIETGFKQFPVLVVPEQVSNKHGIEDPRSLFAYLSNVRICYVAGADLAAIAMCRACTEILLRYHYNYDDETKLTRLAEETQKKPEFAFLRNYNLAEKIEEANRLLHFGKSRFQGSDPVRALVLQWVQVLQEVIARAPTNVR